MPTLKEFIDERSFVTDRISSQVRIIAIGLLATSWSLLIGQVNISQKITEIYRQHLLLISFIATITLMSDYLQYLFSYLSIKRKLTDMEKKGEETSDYNYNDIFYMLSKSLFYIKQFAISVGVIYFVICLCVIFFT